MEWRPQTKKEYLEEKNPVAHECPVHDTNSVFWVNNTWALIVDLLSGWAMVPGIGYCPWCGVELEVSEK